MSLPIETSNKPLPKIDVPVYTVTIPSSKKTIKVRPFNVKEEKLLLMAAESTSGEEIVNTVKQVINNCIVSGTFDVDKAPFFDIDFLFIFLRAKSIGESVEINLTCHNVLKDEEGKICGHTFKTKMDIANNEIIYNDEVTDDVKLDKTSGVKMKYPNYALIKQLDDTPDNEKKTKIIMNSIEHIYDKKGVYSAKDYSSKELKDFIEGLTEENYKKLEAYVDRFPTIRGRIKAECPKCGFNHDVRYTEFYDFFI